MDTNKPLPPPIFTAALRLRPGDVVSIIGCGGKTALLHRLARENRAGAVLLSTTTRMYPPPGELIDRELQPGTAVGMGVSLLCTPAGDKLAGVPFDQLAAQIPPAGLTLLEADGSRGLPLKGWAKREPVIHPRTTVTVGVCTVWPVGQEGEGLIHRPLQFSALTGWASGPVRLEQIAAMVGAPGGMFAKAAGRQLVFINQVESQPAEQLARRLAGLLPQWPVFSGSVRQGQIRRLTGD